jgi:hypothetical protein
MTPRARPSRAVASSMAATWSGPRVIGGSTQAESPEWIPASSMCSITPQTSTFPVVSQSASTSTSTASSRNRSTSTGRRGPGNPEGVPRWVGLPFPERTARAPERARDPGS